MYPGRVANKVALITGGGSGIGEATAKLMAEENAVVFVADVDIAAASSVAQEITKSGGTAHALELDVSDDQNWQAAIDQILAQQQRIDILVNNAGISISKSVSDLSLQDWKTVMGVNLDGVFLGTRQAIRTMKENGSIVNVASVSGITPSGGAAAYCTSKAAVRMFSKAAAIECADAKNGIRVNVVTPGGVFTPMWEKEKFFQAMIEEHGSAEAAFSVIAGDTPSHQFFLPEQVAESILYLASDASAHLTGTEVVLDRGHSS